MKNSKLLTFLLALFASLMLWVYVVTVVNPDGETTISNIPVSFSGAEVLREDQHLIIYGDYDETVTVHFSGKNSDLKKLEQYKDELTAVVDVSKVRSTKEYSLSYEIRYPGAVQASAIEIVDKKPGTVRFTVEKQMTKSVEVKGDYSKVLLEEGYLLDDATFDFDVINVTGPQPIVETISYALVEPERTNVSKTITETLPFKLIDQNGDQISTDDLVLDTDVVEMTLSVVMFKTVKLDVAFIEGGGVTGDDVECVVEPRSITISGDAEILDGINSIVIETIDLSKMNTNSDSLVVPILLPNDTENISGEEEATINLAIKGMDILSFKVSNITFTNVPEGYEASSVSVQIPVLIRCPADYSDKISANSIRIVADLAEISAAEGTVQVPASIAVNGCPEACAIGDYTVVATLSILEENSR